MDLAEGRGGQFPGSLAGSEVGRAVESGLFGLMTTNPPPSRFSLQSTVAPSSFATLSWGTTMAEITLVLHGVAGADRGLRLERKRADVFAVGRARDPHGQDAITGFGRGGPEAAHALEG